ncbi:SgcJ/EcaC family oxidoreductase [Streptomyces sp. NPDC002156]
MKHHLRGRAAIATAAALVAAGTITAGVSAASPEHQTSKPKNTLPSKAEIAGLFDHWNATLQTGDPEKVTALYAPNAVLLPTLSPKIRTTHAEIADYFVTFLKKKPVGEKLQTIINILDDNSAIDTGLYEFHVTDPTTGVKSTVEARYTYEYEKIGGKWLIQNHHSSVLPAE